MSKATYVSRETYENCRHVWSDPKEPSHCRKCGLNRVYEDGVWKYLDDDGHQLTGLSSIDGEEAVAYVERELEKLKKRK